MKLDAVTWLDFRPDDLSNARDFIRSLQEEGVIDELGFLPLLGRFSDLLHPATTTLMRSARYFYFVSGIYRQLESEGVRARQLPDLSLMRQDALATVLSENAGTGVIGRDAGIGLRQFPSNIYWSGLRKLGILTTELSERGYQEQFDEMNRLRRGYRDDDKTPQGPTLANFWDPGLPPAKFLGADGAVEPRTNFILTRAEAADLLERFTSRFPGSLTSHMLQHRLIGIEWPWDCPKTSGSLAVVLAHSKRLSLFVRGASLQYYALLCDALGRLGMQPSTDLVSPVFDKWWAEAARPLKDWDTNELVTVPTVAAALRPGPRGDRWFLDGWLSRLRAAQNAKSLLRDGPARELVGARELKVKRLKARLKYPKYLKQWKPDRVGEGLYQFNYRHNVGARFVYEILDGLERGQ